MHHAKGYWEIYPRIALVIVESVYVSIPYIEQIGSKACACRGMATVRVIKHNWKQQDGRSCRCDTIVYTMKVLEVHTRKCTRQKNGNDNISGSVVCAFSTVDAVLSGLMVRE